MHFIPNLLLKALPSLAACLFGYWLRYGQGMFHASISLSLGYELRAALEHGLAGIAVTLFSLVLYFKNTEKTLFAGAVLGGIYFLSTFSWEYSQAFCCVDGGPPRGRIQWEQVITDSAGVLFGIFCLRCVTPKKHH